MTSWSTKRVSTVVLAGAGLPLFACCGTPTVVMGRSMEPTLKAGQVIWIDRLAYLRRPPRQGEVIVFRWRGRTYVKRVYRAPGDELRYLGRGADVVHILRPAVARELVRRYPRRRVSYYYHVPDDRVFVLGDNYEASVDSRAFGPIPLGCILGRARLPASLAPLERHEISSMPWVPALKHRDSRARSAPLRTGRATTPAQESQGAAAPQDAT